MSEREPSIRIDQDQPAHETRSSQAENPGRGPIIAVVALLAVVIAGLLALRPEQGQSADGTQRQASTTTVAEPPPTTPTTVPLEPLAAALVDVAGSIREVVATDSGYLALLGQETPRVSPAVASSIDGVRWISLETLVVTGGEDDPGRAPVAEFVGLRSTAVGLSVLRARSLGVDIETQVVDRLTSTDGITWSIDGQFGEIFVGQAAAIRGGGDDVLLSVSGPRSGTRVAAETSEFRLIDEGGASEPYSGVGLLSDPHLLEGPGVVAALGLQIPAVQRKDEALAVPTIRPTSLLIWDGPGPAREVPLNNRSVGLSGGDLTSAVVLGSLDDGLIVVARDSLILIELDGRVERLGDFTDIDIDGGVPVAVPGSSALELVDVRDGVLTRWVISEDETVTIRQLVFEQFGFGGVLYVDDDLLLAVSQGVDRAIRFDTR